MKRNITRTITLDDTPRDSNGKRQARKLTYKSTTSIDEVMELIAILNELELTKEEVTR